MPEPRTPTTQSSQGSLNGSNAEGQSQEIPPEMLEKVIERVYQLILKDLSVEQERSGYMGRAMGERAGGW
jgi:hypothetical protein